MFIIIENMGGISGEWSDPSVIATLVASFVALFVAVGTSCFHERWQRLRELNKVTRDEFVFLNGVKVEIQQILEIYRPLYEKLRLDNEFTLKTNRDYTVFFNSNAGNIGILQNEALQGDIIRFHIVLKTLLDSHEVKCDFHSRMTDISFSLSHEVLNEDQKTQLRKSWKNFDECLKESHIEILEKSELIFSEGRSLINSINKEINKNPK